METEESSWDDRVAEARARLEATKAAVARARADLGSSSSTARSKDRAVEVTVGPQGELQRVKFLDEQFRTMEASQLAASIVEAAGKGRAAMARRVKDTFSALVPQGNETGELPGYKIDWEQIFGSALAGGRRGRGAAGPARPAPRNGRRPVRLHDEIVEDGDGD
ncbi:YbaB/EbfC family nucleoid-associated protein [Actinoallomurus spadix]|uniref:YbaB/EbfC DNA-binding family protein n=1 Tax=Actinoallomurus spadix TaxID=79912 RepID=A0ABN0XH05_9ACTN|nr:YbaB/EbfC family nucleoid-associated protein [Actinoallomurus spadix]MCO5991691.1 YbaB/EbfC family nucleoid-associated protein [Actinoallomurus spadix]